MKNFREFLRSSTKAYFENLECDGLFFVSSGKIFIYPNGIENSVAYGKELDYEYVKYICSNAKINTEELYYRMGLVREDYEKRM